jgi:hypothetical protein
MQPGERVAPCRFINVGIDLQRGADPAVSEDGLGVTCRDVQVLEKRCYEVPEVVDLDRPELVAIADAAEGLHGPDVPATGRDTGRDLDLPGIRADQLTGHDRRQRGTPRLLRSLHDRSATRPLTGYR